ncbi:MAG: GTPase ObgE [Sandaracinaceae bacterium]|nr:GTPase ObgE [Sandaracinaceae bacterium]MBK6813827.1 GTPase ObgE [Sandaracinaceae bacterium]MBK8409582.1 GTPase ObgE [Sandaracinaceae bacterium]MBK8593740.1 GTPase ObgE [Sandaracinaceae bacterium]
MRFVDLVEIEVQAGNGGNGAVAFRREKYVPLGGPSGGDGGDGGDIVFEAHERMSTLMDLHYRRHLTAPPGEHGRGKDQFGHAGRDEVVQVPVGTQVYDADTGELLVDLAEPGQTFVVARGGKGGRGNMRFATPFDRAPRRADPGEEGEHRNLKLELKLMADVGVVGFPNVGKSTFIAAVSRATPKIADYPFTTLVPNLGVASLGPDRNFVVADIPGIIEGASEGAGLGLRFLRHVERNRVLLHVITYDPDPSRDPVADYKTLLNEMATFDASLLERPAIVAFSKMDLLEAQEALEASREGFAELGIKVMPFSAATREGLDAILLALEAILRKTDPARVTSDNLVLGARPQDLHDTAGSGSRTQAQSDDDDEAG